MNYDEVRLQIFSEQGELLAERFYEPILGLDALTPIKYGEDYLIYNKNVGQDFQVRLSIPPGRLEWIRARLPRLWP